MIRKRINFIAISACITVKETSECVPIIWGPFAAISIHHMQAVGVPWFWRLILKTAVQIIWNERSKKRVLRPSCYWGKSLISLSQKELQWEIPTNLWWIRSPWITTIDPAFTSIGTKSFWSYVGKGRSKETPSSPLIILLTSPSVNNTK